ncbi:dienelactone hydrolase family protein [Nocardia africana]|uniref:Carboxymethylenebutenolidase n=1 Tax=Nocardia africana TaxID=134964 RepID=A0A378WRX7_9NOCA|nr:dienelactone hydrolase family protein [Nocardia africana]MCC3314266.1 dienelactone hydrolase family protein [Nocardia africana]SUA43477.1 Carboxymethylenebutenolidase [Nocardia africana]
MTEEILGQHAEVEVDGSPMAVYLARPVRSGRLPVVLVGAELWGLTAEVRAVTDRVAALGYVTVVANLYHRCGPETAAGLAESDENRARAFELLGNLTRDGVEADLRAAVAFARAEGEGGDTTGALGFSLGGHITYFAATRLELAAAAIFYPGWLPVAGTALSIPDPLLAHTSSIAERGTRLLILLAERDHVIDAEQRTAIDTALAQAGAEYELVVYPGAQHAYFFAGRPVHDAVAAADSWQRVTELFATTLGSVTDDFPAPTPS